MTVQPAGHPNAEGPEIDEHLFLEANQDAKTRYGRFNLAVVGATGVGKSSLVNAVFGRQLAQVGKGMPVTQGINYYFDGALGIWDFEGFEIGTSDSPSELLRGHLRSIEARPANEHISVVWYCVTANADRLTQHDLETIRALDASGLPVILVLTKTEWTKNPVTGKYKPSRDTAEFYDWLQDPHDHAGNPIDLPVREVILTSAVNRARKGAGPGLGDLLSATLALSPEADKDALRVAQRLNLPWKRKLARPVIAAAAAAAAGAAAVPIPVADAVTLAPIQLAMMGRIAAIYELEMKSMLTSAAIAQLGTQIAGQALARSFIKLIPGVGSVVNASVALALTSATGEAWLRLCEQVHTGKIDLSQVENAWKDFSPSIISVVQKLTELRFSRQ